jgi:hypothetical protein
MTELEGSGGESVGKLWRKHGGGYYALLAVGTFVYMEVQSIIESIADADSVGNFVSSEILTLGIETFLNTFFSGMWPMMWVSWMGLGTAAAAAGGGYAVWTITLASLLARREKEYRKELGL